MINRTIIRIKVLQIIYSFYQKESRDLKLAENELSFSIQKSYDLYYYLLFLIVLLTNTEQKRLDIRKRKYLATDQEKNPNTRFIDNRFAVQLSNNESLLKFVGEKGTLWNEDESLVRILLDKIIDSDIYKEYLVSPDTYDSDREFWRKVFKEFIYTNEDLEAFLEDKSIYWNDDLDIVGTFVLKTIKRFDVLNGEKQELLPMFRDNEDRSFATSLLHYAILKEKEYNDRITKHIKNWDVDRIAVIDLYIMQIAMAEISNYPSIPIRVSLNEYIDIAKVYSTPKSGTFINGILDVIVNELKTEHLLFKTE